MLIHYYQFGRRYTLAPLLEAKMLYENLGQALEV